MFRCRSKYKFYSLCVLIVINLTLILLAWKFMGWKYISLQNKFVWNKISFYNETALAILSRDKQGVMLKRQDSQSNQDGNLTSLMVDRVALTSSRDANQTNSMNSNKETNYKVMNQTSDMMQLISRERNTIGKSRQSEYYSLKTNFTRNIKHFQSTGRSEEKSYFPPDNSVKEESGNLSYDTDTRPETCKNCFHPKFTYILNPMYLCKRQKVISLFIMIESSASNIDNRNVIRKTWANTCYKKSSTIRCLFIIGLSSNSTTNLDLQYESAFYNDLLQINYTDTYANLTYKTLGGLYWVSKFCRSAEYIMKTDDDMFVNTKLIPIMLEAAPPSGFYGGSCWGQSEPSRDNQSKWYVSYKQLPTKTLPPMCSGVGYIMSFDVLKLILKHSKNIPFFHLEDVYIAMCIRKSAIRAKNFGGFTNIMIDFSPCTYRDHVMTSHGFSPMALYYVWKEMSMCSLPVSKYLPADLYKEIPYSS